MVQGHGAQAHVDVKPRTLLDKEFEMLSEKLHRHLDLVAAIHRQRAEYVTKATSEDGDVDLLDLVRRVVHDSMQLSASLNVDELLVTVARYEAAKVRRELARAA